MSTSLTFPTKSSSDTTYDPFHTDRKKRTARELDDIKAFASFERYVRAKDCSSLSCQELVKMFFKYSPRHETTHAPRLLYNLLRTVSNTPCSFDTLSDHFSYMNELTLPPSSPHSITNLELMVIHYLAFLSALAPHLSAADKWHRTQTWLKQLQQGFAFPDFEKKRPYVESLIRIHFLQKDLEWRKNEKFVETVQSYVDSQPSLSDLPPLHKGAHTYKYLKNDASSVIPDSEPVAETFAKILILQNFTKTNGPIFSLLQDMISYQQIFWPFRSQADLIANTVKYCEKVHSTIQSILTSSNSQRYIDYMLYKAWQWLLNKDLFMSYNCFTDGEASSEIVQRAIQSHSNHLVSHETIIQHASEEFKAKAQADGLDITEAHLHALRLLYIHHWYKPTEEILNTIQRSIRWIITDLAATVKNPISIEVIKKLFQAQFPSLPFDKSFAQLQLMKTYALRARFATEFPITPLSDKQENS